MNSPGVSEPAERHRFDAYGRFRLEVVREGTGWVVYRVGLGTRRRDPDIVVPAHVRGEDLAAELDDLLHEYARPGQALRRLPGTTDPEG